MSGVSPQNFVSLFDGYKLPQSVADVGTKPIETNGPKDGVLALDELRAAGQSLVDLGANRTAAQEQQGNLINTFFHGGKNQSGLMPDFNKDGKLDQTEIDRLAAADGDASLITTADFKALFDENDQLKTDAATTAPPATDLMQKFGELPKMMLGLVLALFLMPLLSGMGKPQSIAK